MRVLIGGKSGFVGANLTRLLKKHSHEVVGISRRSSEEENNLTWADLHRDGLPEEFDAVVNLAGENVMNPRRRWDSDFRSALRSSRIDTTRQLVTAISKAKNPPKVFVSTSAVGFYPPSQTEEYTEDSQPPNTDFMTQLCRDWEASAKLPAGTSTRAVTIRIGIALGRDGGTIASLYAPFYMGLGGRMASGKQWFPWCHVHDVAGIFAHAIENEHVTGVLNAVAPCQNTNEDFTKALGRAMWRPTLIPMPKVALDLVYGPERASIVTEGQKVLPTRTLQSGYDYQYPNLQSACKEFARPFLGITEFRDGYSRPSSRQ